MKTSTVNTHMIIEYDPDKYGILRSVLAVGKIKYFRKSASINDAEVAAWTMKSFIASYFRRSAISEGEVSVMEDMFKPAMNILIQNERYEEARNLSRIMACFSSVYSAKCNRSIRPTIHYLFKLATTLAAVTDFKVLESEGRNKLAGFLAAHIETSDFLRATDDMLDVTSIYTGRDSLIATHLWSLIYAGDYIRERSDRKLDLLHTYLLQAKNGGVIEHFQPIPELAGDEEFSAVYNEALALYQINPANGPKF